MSTLDLFNGTGSHGDMRNKTNTALEQLNTDKVEKVTGESLVPDAEITKLAGIAAGAQVNTVDSVNGETGVVVLDKTHVGLSNVDNTSDMDKPVSVAQQAAIDASGGGGGGGSTGLVQGVAGKETKVMAFVARQTGDTTGWDFINDSTHVPMNTLSASVNGTGNLVVVHGQVWGTIGTLNVSTDETYTELGVRVGPSVGLSSTVFEFYADLEGSITGSGDQGILVNTGAAPDFTQVFDRAAGTITVTHAAQSHVSAAGTAVITSVLADNRGGTIQVQSQSKTGFTLAFLTPLQGIILVGGGVWGYAGNSVGVTVEADATGWDITHPILTSDDHVVVQQQQTTLNVHYATSNVNDTSFRVTAIDNATGNILAPSSAHRFSFGRTGQVPTSLPTSPFGTVRRSNIHCHADKIFHPSANIWVSAIYEPA